MGKSKNITQHQNALADAERAAQRLGSVTPPPGRPMTPDSGVERDFREVDAANGK